MMTRVTSRNLRDLVILEAPPLAASLIVAELYFKFGSFLLEAIGFLAVWYLLSLLYLRWIRRGALR